MTAQRGSRLQSWTAGALAAMVLLLAAAVIPLSLLARQDVVGNTASLAIGADTTVAAFAARLHDATDPDDVRSDLVATVHHSLEPAHVSVWTVGPTT